MEKYISIHALVHNAEPGLQYDDVLNRLGTIQHLSFKRFRRGDRETVSIRMDIEVLSGGAVRQS